MSLKILSLLKSKEYNDDDCSKLLSHTKEQEAICILFKIKEYFPNIIKLEENTYRIECSTEYKSTDFTIINNSIKLLYLYKCEVNSGTEILLKIKKMAIELNITYIDLTDASIIEIDDCINICSYSFATYYILLYGISWYNKYGFVSTTHYEDKTYNNKIRKLPFNKFIEQAINKYDIELLEIYKYKKKKLTKYNFKSSKNIIRKIEKYFPEICIESPTNDIIKIIDSYLKKNNNNLECNNPKIKIILELIELAEYMLQYNSILKWNNPN